MGEHTAEKTRKKIQKTIHIEFAFDSDLNIHHADNSHNCSIESVHSVNFTHSRNGVESKQKLKKKNCKGKNAVRKFK